MYNFSITDPVTVENDTMMIDFQDASEPFDARQFKLHIHNETLEVNKLTVYRPRLDCWQDITSMLSPFYLAAVKNELLQKLKSMTDTTANSVSL